MRFTYIASANNAVTTATLSDGSSLSTAGQPLGNVGQDVLVYKILIGLPVANGNIVVKNKSLAGAFATDTSDTAFKFTIPATLGSSYTNVNGTTNVIDFGDKGLQLDGGNVQIDQTMQVTVIWKFKDDTDAG